MNAMNWARLLKRRNKYEPPPPARRRCDLVVVVAVSDGEWTGVEDLFESLETYVTCDYEIVCVDDATSDGTYEKLLASGVWAVRNPEKLYLWGNDLTVRRGFYHAVNLFESPIYLKIDPDALIIGHGLYEAMAAKFEESGGTGLIGTFRLDWNGEPRNFEYWRNHMYRVKEELGEPFSMAVRNGYVVGEGIQGGAYAMSRSNLEAINSNGWLQQSRGYDPPRVKGRRVAEDHLISMLTFASGFGIAEFGGPGQPFGLWDVGLPMLPGELVEQGRLVTHAIKYSDPVSLDCRAFFKNKRKEDRPE